MTGLASRTIEPGAPPRSGPIGRLLIVVLTAGSILPFVCARVLPIVDLAVHALEVAQWRAWSTDPIVRTHYTLHLASPYAAVYCLWRGLAGLGLSLTASSRWTVALCVLALPPSFWFLLHTRRRAPDSLFFLFALLYMDPLAWGMLPFYASVSVFFCALALFALWMRQPTLTRALGVALGGLLLLWSHALSAALWGLSCCLLALFDAAPWRRRLFALLPLIPVGALCVGWATTHTHGDVHHVTHLIQRARKIGGLLFGQFTGDPMVLTRVACLAAAALALAGALARGAARRASANQPDGTDERLDLPLLAAGGAALAVFFTVPDGVDWTWHLNTRFLAPALLLIFAALPPPPWRSVRGLVSGLLVVAAINQWVAVGIAFRRFDRDLGDAESLFAALPPHASVVRPDGTPDTLEPWRKPVLNHLAAWAQAYDLGPSPEFIGNAQALVQHSETNPWPVYSARLDAASWTVHRSDGLLPDFLLFYAPRTPPERLAVAESSDPYVLWRRTGGLCAYRRASR